jgi:predicted anti-sigma-YlaC factor YlaD
MNCQEAIDVMGEAVTNELSPALQPGFREHMDECVSCRTYFDQLCVTRRAVRALPAEPPPVGRLRELIRKFREEFDSRPR